MTYDELRQALPEDLPWAIREVLVGNVVVGNYTPHQALLIGRAIDRKHPAQPDLFKL